MILAVPELVPFAKVDELARITRLLDTAEPRLARAFLRAISQIRNSFTLAEIEARLLFFGLDSALRFVETNLGIFTAEWASVYVGAGQSASTVVGGELGIVASFDQVNVRAVSAIQNNQLRLIREFTQEQRATVNQALTRGITSGANPRQQARAFRDSIGLTRRQEAAVSNFRRLLQEGNAEALTRRLRDRRFDGSIRAAVEGRRALTSQQIDTMVGRYRDRYVRYRSEVIGRTEALRSVHEGNDEMFRQAIDDGSLQRDAIIREWSPANDPRVRDSHDAMRGQTRGVDEPFESGLGNQLRFPGDSAAPPEDTVQCRCAVLTRFRRQGQPAP